ncbi:PH domain-containing protein [Actinomycetospora succinea]|uniref:PH domain-containing protein n=1 Tax=Actinomycetospora succinea TaxID=663603 RepID=UPI001414FCEA|nr:PH domain-containing protein [Actinomycetospora succinea]
MTSEQTSDDPVTAASGPATFRPVPLVALIAVGFLLIGLSPIAFQGGAWFLVLLLPLLPAWWLLRTRTVVDGTALHVRLAWGAHRVPWDDVATLRVAERGWVRAVRGEEAARSGAGAAAPKANNSEVALVGVRPRDLGRVARASDGRIDMPTPDEVAAAREHQRELEATRMRIAKLRERQAAETGQETGHETVHETEDTAGDEESRA